MHKQAFLQGFVGRLNRLRASPVMLPASLATAGGGLGYMGSSGQDPENRLAGTFLGALSGSAAAFLPGVAKEIGTATPAQLDAFRKLVRTADGPGAQETLRDVARKMVEKGMITTDELKELFAVS